MRIQYFNAIELKLKLVIYEVSDTHYNNITCLLTVVQEWINPLLTWNASKYGGIDEINVDPSTIWVPDIVLYNRY